MTHALPVLKAKVVVGALKNLGFIMVRQRGTHQQYRHVDGRSTTVPMHSGRDISPLLLRQICKDIGITTAELLKNK